MLTDLKAPSHLIPEDCFCRHFLASLMCFHQQLNIVLSPELELVSRAGLPQKALLRHRQAGHTCLHVAAPVSTSLGPHWASARLSWLQMESLGFWRKNLGLLPSKLPGGPGLCPGMTPLPLKQEEQALRLPSQQVQCQDVCRPFVSKDFLQPEEGACV